MMRPKTFMKSVRFQTASWPGYQLETGQVDEGFSFELSPLLSIDGTTVDAVIKCHVDQVEKMVPVTVDVANTQGNQRVQIQVPQVVSWRLHERFRWPTTHVLLISAGIVATPGEGKTTTPFMIRNPFEFAPPPEIPGDIRLPDRPAPLTRAETVDLMREAGFTDLEVRRSPDLSPIRDADRVAVFTARRPR